MKKNFAVICTKILSGFFLVYVSTGVHAEIKEISSQTIKFNHPLSWHMIDQSSDKEGTAYTFAPMGESMSNWKQNIRTILIPYAKMPGITGQAVMRIQIEDAQKACKKVVSKVLAQNKQSITYTLDVYNCSGSENQRQVGKSFNGVEGVHNAIYAAFVGDVSEDDYKVGSKLIQTSTLISNPLYPGR